MSQITTAIEDQARGRAQSDAGQVARLMRYALRPILDMRASRDLKRDLQMILATRSACVVEAQGVERLSTACIQVLIAFLGAAKRDALTVTLLRPSQAFVRAFDELGVPALNAHWKVET